jgi:hypothetical protein
MAQTEYIVPVKLITLNERINQEFMKLKLPLTDKLQKAVEELPEETDAEVFVLQHIIKVSSAITIADENDQENLEKAGKISKLMKKFNDAVDGWAKQSKEDADALRDRINKRRDQLKTLIAEVKANVDPKLEAIKLQTEKKMKEQEDALNERYIKRYDTFVSKGMVYNGIKKRFEVPGHPAAHITEDEMRLWDSEQLKKKFMEDIVPTLMVATMATATQTRVEPEQEKPVLGEQFVNTNQARLSELCGLFGTRIEDNYFMFPSGAGLKVDSLYLYSQDKYRDIIARERQLAVTPENDVVPNPASVVGEDSTLSEKLAADLVLLTKAYNDVQAILDLKLHSEMMRHGLNVFRPKTEWVLSGLKGMINDCKKAEEGRHL